MPPAAAPPSAPSGVTIIESAPPKPLPAPTSTIHVTPPSSVPTATEPPKAGSAKSRMFEELRKKAKPAFGQPTEPAQPAPQTPAAAPATPDPSQGTPTGEPAAGGDPEAPAGTPAAEEPAAAPAGKAGKQSPWKLVDDYKKRLTAAEKQLAEARSAVVPEEERKTITERLQKAETRAKELEDHMRYLDYSRSDEFQSKYVKPYENAVASAMSELSEIMVTDAGTSQQRAATVSDLFQVVNQPLSVAKELAEQIFGDFADDVMRYRKDIRTAFDAQQKALEEAKKSGAEHFQKQAEAAKEAKKIMEKHVSETWTAANNEAQSHPKVGKFFKPIEGDEKWNKSLESGYKLVDEAFSQTPFDPKLKPEERATIVRKHAAVRNRAAAFAGLVSRIEAQEAQITELQKELKGFKEVTPNTAAGGQGAPSQAANGSAMSQALSKLRAMAK